MGFFTTVLGDILSLGNGVNTLSGPGGSLSGLSDVGSVLTAFFTSVTDARMWRSFGWLLLGIIMIGAGMALWAKQSVIPSVRGAVGA